VWRQPRLGSAATQPATGVARPPPPRPHARRPRGPRDTAGAAAAPHCHSAALPTTVGAGAPQPLIRARAAVGGGRLKVGGGSCSFAAAFTVSWAPQEPAKQSKKICLVPAGRRCRRQPEQNAILFGRLLPNRRPIDAILLRTCSVLGPESQDFLEDRAARAIENGIGRSRLERLHQWLQRGTVWPFGRLEHWWLGSAPKLGCDGAVTTHK